eukprot:4823288-Amphidinium_carterae.4
MLAVQDTPALPTLLPLFRAAAAAARTFWSLFSSAKSTFREQTAASSPNPRASAAAAAAPFSTEVAEIDSAISGTFALLHSSDVRVDDDLMDQRVPEDQASQEQLVAALEMDAQDATTPAQIVFPVDIAAAMSRPTKAGGALPALPPGSLTRGKQKGSCKKPRLMPDREPVRETLASLCEQTEREFGTAEAPAGPQNFSTATGSSSALSHQSGAEIAEEKSGEPARTSENKRGIRVVPSHSVVDREQLVCLQCLPVVVYDGVQPCGLGCGSSVCARHARRRTIRDQDSRSHCLL